VVVVEAAVRDMTMPSDKWPEGYFAQHFGSLRDAGLERPPQAAAVEYGRIRGHLAAAGTPIGPNDLMIAAIAQSRRLTLVTHNTREFSRVPGLLIEDWELP
jgi:predicted nucleic acid-binding protein